MGDSEVQRSVISGNNQVVNDLRQKKTGEDVTVGGSAADFLGVSKGDGL